MVRRTATFGAAATSCAGAGVAVLAAGRGTLGAGAAARAPGSAAGGGSTNDLLLFVAVAANVHAPTRTDPAAEE